MSNVQYTDHYGGCHCGAVKYKVYAPTIIEAVDCDCSICKKKQNIHFIVPASHFQLLQGEDHLTEYRFNTKQARHLFCSICGVQSFYRPRSHPDGYGVMPHCIDSNTIKEVKIERFHGQAWEETMAEAGEEFLSRSKNM